MGQVRVPNDDWTSPSYLQLYQDKKYDKALNSIYEFV